MISVVIPLYNKERQIANTLRTVLCQTFQDFEIVIVNDGSTDNSVAEVAKISDPRIRLINQDNAGVSAARNKGIEEAKGEYVALLDADDEWNTEYLATQIQHAETYPQCDVFAVNYQFSDANGKISDTIIRNLPFAAECGVLSNYFEVASTSHPPLWTSAVMVRKKAFQEIGGFPVGIKSGEDLLTWARLACKYKIAYSKKILAQFIQTSYQAEKDSKSSIRLGSEETVLNELKNLYNSDSLDINTRKGLKSYIHRWYKIYCVLLIEAKQNHKIIPVAISAIRFGAPTASMLMLMCFAILPADTAKTIFLKLRR